MSQILKVKEWQGASGNWYVGDVDTWTGWRAIADMMDIDMDGYIDMLVEKYHAFVEMPENDFILFFWTRDDYKYAHKFLLDVNRIARNRDWKVEKTIWERREV